MKQIYRTPSDLKNIPNGMWKSYVLDMLKRGPVEADPKTGSARPMGEFPTWYKDDILYGGEDGHRLSEDEIYQLQTGQLRTDEVLIPTEVISPSRKTKVPQPAPAPKQSSHVHGVLRGMVGEAALAQAYVSAKRIQRAENMRNAARHMSREQIEKMLRGK